MVNDIYDLDAHKKVRCVDESLPATSSAALAFSMPLSPALSPATALQSEFSNLLLPTAALPQRIEQLGSSKSVSNKYHNNRNSTEFSPRLNSAAPFGNPVNMQFELYASERPAYTAQLRILEQPVEKFRFRYKSEMHGTHGSLNGINSKRTPKTFPEVKLEGYAGNAVILCSLFQTDIKSPHSHQLIVRHGDNDVCDPHELYVSPEKGYIAQFQNMGIIHTAKKYIYDELLLKKRARLHFELGRVELSSREEQLLLKETEMEVKAMNLNQVRLCFEAFKLEADRTWTRIAAPVYTHSINNRKSAQTGDLRICRLSIASGHVSGGDDLILLVEKVSKKNIKVRFFEINDDEEIVWEAFGKFRESDVHHQYAIICTTPPYRNKDIESPVDVYIELLRPSDDERSYPPVTFRYKPRSSVMSRKRKRTCSSTSTPTAQHSDSTTLSSLELPKTVQEQILLDVQTTPITKHQIESAEQQQQQCAMQLTISEEYNKEWQLKSLLSSEELHQMISNDSEQLLSICPIDTFSDLLEHDGVPSAAAGTVLLDQKMSEQKKRKLLVQSISNTPNEHLKKMTAIYQRVQTGGDTKSAEHAAYARQVADIFRNYTLNNEDNDSIMHEIVMMDNVSEGIKMCVLLKYFHLEDLLNTSLNQSGESCLHCACLHNKSHFIRPLLMLGCDANIQDRAGNTALHIAVQECNKHCINSFLRYMLPATATTAPSPPPPLHRINLKLTNDDGLSVLHLAVRRNSSLEVIEKLLQYDKHAALVGNTIDGNNLLHMAVLQKNAPLVKLFLQLQIGGLKRCNLAGLTAAELAKTLKPWERNVILDLLQQTDVSVDIRRSPLFIKEEEMSSSSSCCNSDDEADDVKNFEEASTSVHLNATEDKNMNESQSEMNDMNVKLEEFLVNELNFKRLSRQLGEEGRWCQMAKLLRIEHLLCLWRNAAAMLSYVRSNVRNIGADAFIKALEEVDKDAASIISDFH